MCNIVFLGEYQIKFFFHCAFYLKLTINRKDLVEKNRTSYINFGKKIKAQCLLFLISEPKSFGIQGRAWTFLDIQIADFEGQK